MKRRFTFVSAAGAENLSMRSFELLDGLEVTDRELADTAHILRRLTLTIGPRDARARLDEHGSADAVLEAVLAAPPVPFEPPGDLDVGLDDVPKALEDSDRMLVWWLDRMRAPASGLHERMVWFWHTVITTSVDKAPTLACWRQLRTFHEHALGNFGQLVRAMLDDLALFVYLDADGSQRTEPNENLSRELLELFTLGIGNYTQADVSAGAHVLAGRRLDWEAGTIIVDENQPRPGRQDYLGQPEVRTLDDLVAAILASDACAAFIVHRVWDHFVGGEIDQSLIDDWSALFRSGGYEIAPLMDAVVRSDAFRSARLTRPRTGLEWFLAAIAVTGHDEWSVWDLNSVGQLPYRPPNVAGWPGTTRWTSSTAMLGRGSWITWFAPPVVEQLIAGGVVADGGDGLVDRILEHCSMFEVTERSRRALGALASELLPFEPDGDPTLAVTAVLRAATLTPEFTLS